MRGCLIRCLSVSNCLDYVNKRGKTKPTVDITIPQAGGPELYKSEKSS